MLNFDYVRKQLAAAQRARTPSARADALSRLSDGLDHLEYAAGNMEESMSDAEVDAFLEAEADRIAMEADAAPSEPVAYCVSADDLLDFDVGR